MRKELESFSDVNEALRYMREQKYVHVFQFSPRGWRCQETGEEYMPEEMVVDACHRFSQCGGANRVTMLYAVRSPKGKKGVILDNCSTYGNYLFGEHLIRMKLGQRQPAKNERFDKTRVQK